ncbi:MAG: chorismate synthase [bacterium]
MLRYMTAGESHGPCLTSILSGMPAGLSVDEAEINEDLRRRQGGYGRGGRMSIEKDAVRFTSGIRHGKTLGSPITMVIENRDWKNWEQIMSARAEDATDQRAITRPRPGHADLPGVLKFDQKDARNVLERASARETASRVAIGAICKQLLAEFGVEVFSHVVALGGIRANLEGFTYAQIHELAERSETRCADPKATKQQIALIDQMKKEGDTLGGVLEIVATNLPAGLGTCMNWDEKLDGRLAQALMSIQAIKGVEIGLGFEGTNRPGSKVHDEIFYSKNPKDALNGHGPSAGFYRVTNGAGGLEGSMTNGEPLVVRMAMKPISTLMRSIQSVDFVSKEAFDAAKERSDVCSVPAAGVVGEAAVAFVLAQAWLEKFGGDSLSEVRRNHEAYCKYLKEF